MLLDDLDWFDVYRRLDAWQALAPASRKAYSALRPSDRVPASTFGDDLPALVDGRFLSATGGDNVHVHPDAKPLVRAFRLMVRHPVLERHDRDTLVRYFTELLVGWERQELGSAVGLRHSSHETLAEHVSSVDWPRRFAQPQEQDERSIDGGLPAARRLVAELLERPGPLSLGDLPERLRGFDGEERWAAVNLAIANLAVFPVFLETDEPLAEPGLTLWPPAARRHFAPPPQAPSERVPERSWQGPLLIHDLGALLMAAAAEPLRIRQSDGAFYVRTAEDLAAALTPRPEWLTGAIQGLDNNSRLARARRLLQETGLLEGRRLSGGRVGLVPGQDAEEWIALGPTRQLRLVLDRWRVAEGFDKNFGDDVDDDLDDGFDDDSDDDFASHAFFPDELTRYQHTYFRGYSGRLRGTADDLASAIRDAVERARSHGFVRLEDFAEHEAELHNPLDADGHRLRVGWGWGRDTTETLRRVWADELRAFVLNRLAMVAGARIGLDDEGLLVFEPTSAGRYLVGLTDSFEIERPDETGTVVVQPDFDVVFLAPAPDTEAAVSRFAERLGHGVGTLFRLTREASFAAAAGLSADAVLQTLEAAAAQPIPPNVEHEIRTWFDRARRLPVRRTLVVECGSEEVARRLTAAGGKDVRLLGDDVVEVPKGKIGRRLARRAAAQGLFLAPPEE
ncbi:MAG: helicase-associated domain-containing protein [Acidobacteriota bacterium]